MSSTAIILFGALRVKIIVAGFRLVIKLNSVLILTFKYTEIFFLFKFSQPFRVVHEPADMLPFQTDKCTRGYQKVLSLRHFPHSDSTMLHT